MQKKTIKTKVVINYRVVSVLLALLASACVAVNETNIHSTIEVSTSQPTPIPSPSVLALTLVADTEYAKECQKINPSRLEDQIGYRNIFPGRASVDEVKKVFGLPIEENSQVSPIWNYDGFSIVFRREIVDSIYIYDDKDLFIDLENIILKYGCPSLIFAIDIGVEPIGFYSLTEFIYPDLGVVFDFGNFPVSLEETPEMINVFRPQTLSNYLHFSNKVNFTPNTGIPVSWNDAVK